MEENRTNVDKIRPILQAMERSIDAARRERLSGEGEDDPAERNGDPAAQADDQQRRSDDDQQQDEQPRISGPTTPEQARKMKARPKRPSEYDDMNRQNYHSQAG